MEEVQARQRVGLEAELAVAQVRAEGQELVPVLAQEWFRWQAW